MSGTTLTLTSDYVPYNARELDGFLYDATVLQYMVAQDDDCEILTVGAWYGMTGYGVGFRRGSKYLDQFNEKLMQYKDNGGCARRSTGTTRAR